MENTSKMPSQIKYIVGNEACERFSFYGMRTILVVFMIQQLGKSAADSKAVYHLFLQAAYFLPLLGAYLADRVLGKYKTILYLSIFYCIGHGVLAVWENEAGLYAGLALIAFGSGGIKPCVSAHVGDQFNKSNQHLLERVFSLFYFSINFGAFFSSLLTPWLLTHYGASVAFGIPGLLMLLATIVFWMGRNEYVHVPPSPAKTNSGFMSVFLFALKQKFSGQTLSAQALAAVPLQQQSFLDLARAQFDAHEVIATKAAWNIIKLFATVTVFWALFDQQGSSWTIQAQRMNLQVLGMTLEASQIQAINPILVLLLIPLFSFGLYPMIEKLGVRVTALRKMSFGMLLAGSAFVASALIEMALDSGNQLNVAWQIIPYALITASEVMVSITGLEFAYTQAPPSMKSTLMSFWLLTVALGNFLVALIAKLNVFSGAQEYLFFASLMGLVALIFSYGASKFPVQNFMQDSK